VAVKVNVAFFEAYGSAGWAALERLRADVPADQVLILDAKRGDLASTAERYAEALLGHLAADGVTLSPYLGEDGIEPFRAFPDRLLYVLARTSNPSAVRLQHLVVEGGELLSEHVGAWVAERWPVPEVGLVVGATAPDELRALRDRIPGPAFLVPGVGAQGGDLEAAVAAARGAMAPGVVNVSRAIADAAKGAEWRRAVAAAAEEWRARMAGASATLRA
jgi:orotidine 5'-phosphate decarboxylase subfamily 2